MCIPNVSWTPLGYMLIYVQNTVQNAKIHVFSLNVTEHVRYVWDTSRYIRIYAGYIRIHQDTYPDNKYTQTR